MLNRLQFVNKKIFNLRVNYQKICIFNIINTFWEMHLLFGPKSYDNKQREKVQQFAQKCANKKFAQADMIVKRTQDFHKQTLLYILQVFKKVFEKEQPCHAIQVLSDNLQKQNFENALKFHQQYCSPTMKQCFDKIVMKVRKSLYHQQLIFCALKSSYSLQKVEWKQFYQKHSSRAKTNNVTQQLLQAMNQYVNQNSLKKEYFSAYSNLFSFASLMVLQIIQNLSSPTQIIHQDLVYKVNNLVLREYFQKLYSMKKQYLSLIVFYKKADRIAKEESQLLKLDYSTYSDSACRENIIKMLYKNLEKAKNQYKQSSEKAYEVYESYNQTQYYLKNIEQNFNSKNLQDIQAIKKINRQMKNFCHNIVQQNKQLKTTNQKIIMQVKEITKKYEQLKLNTNLKNAPNCSSCKILQQKITALQSKLLTLQKQFWLQQKNISTSIFGEKILLLQSDLIQQFQFGQQSKINNQEIHLSSQKSHFQKKQSTQKSQKVQKQSVQKRIQQKKQQTQYLQLQKKFDKLRIDYQQLLLQHQDQKKKFLIEQAQYEKKNIQNQNQRKEIKQKQILFLKKISQYEQKMKKDQFTQQKKKKNQLDEQKSKWISCFQNEILAKNEEYKCFLYYSLRNKLKRDFSTRLLFRSDPLNNINFHKYLDGHPHYVAVIKMVSEYILAVYSQTALNPQILDGDSMIVSLTNKRVFVLNPGQRSQLYNEYYLIFGNAQLRMDFSRLIVFSNLGAPTRSYNNQGQGPDILFGKTNRPNVKEIAAVSIQIYQMIF